MRLIRDAEGGWNVQFTVIWEIAYLQEQGERWVPFCRFGHATPIGEIHATTHEVRLYAGIQLANRQAVILAPTSTNA